MNEFDDCDKAVRAVYRYLDQQVDMTEEVGITEHLRRCRGCSDAVEFERSFLLRIRSACPEEPPAHLLENVRRLLREAGDG